MQEQQRRSRGDTSQLDPYDHAITLQYDDLGVWSYIWFIFFKFYYQFSTKISTYKYEFNISSEFFYFQNNHFLFLLSQQTSFVRCIMPQSNKRPRVQPQYVCSDHEEHHRPHVPVCDRQTSSSTRSSFNAVDFNIPDGEIFLRNYSNFNASQENLQNMGRGGSGSSSGRSGSNLPQYYDD